MGGSSLGCSKSMAWFDFSMSCFLPICCVQRLGFWTLQNHCPDVAGTIAAACEKFKAWLVSWSHLIEADKRSLHENSKTGWLNVLNKNWFASGFSWNRKDLEGLHLWVSVFDASDCATTVWHGDTVLAIHLPRCIWARTACSTGQSLHIL